MLGVGLRNCGSIYYYFSSVFVSQKSLLNPLKEANAQNHTTNHSCSTTPLAQARSHSSVSTSCHDAKQSYGYLVSFFNVIIIVVYMVGGRALHATVHKWKSEADLVELVFPVYLYLGGGVQLRWGSLRGKHNYCTYRATSAV